MNRRSFIISALVAGLVMGFLGNFPGLNLLNCFLCLWVWLSGILAVFLYRRFTAAQPDLSMGQAAALGAVSGVVGALIGAVFAAIFNAILGGLGVFKGLESMQSQPGTFDFFKLITSPSFPIVSLLIDLVLYALFGAVGGVIAVTAIWKTPKPAGNAS